MLENFGSAATYSEAKGLLGATVHFDGDHMILDVVAQHFPVSDAATRAVLFIGPEDHADGLPAAIWAEKITQPKTLLDKLGVKPGHNVAVLGVRDADFLAMLESPGKRLKQNLDFVCFGAEGHDF